VTTRTPTSAARTLRSLLVASVQQDTVPPLEALAACSPEQAVDAANRHRITPAVYLAVKGVGLPDAWLAALHAAYEQQLLRHLTTAADLALVTEVLSEVLADVPPDQGSRWAVMKGPVLSDCLWPRPDMRQYYDLDVLVDRRRYRAVLNALVERGARLIDGNWPLVAAQMRAELSVLLPYGTVLDLHWDLVNEAGIRRQLDLPTGDLLDRVRPVTVGALEVPTFDAPDTLLSLALHADLAGATRLVWLKDIERAAAADGLDWDEVGRRAAARGLGLALALALGKTERVLGIEGGMAGGARRGRSGRARRAGRTASAAWTAWAPWALAASVADRLVATPGLSDEQHSGQLIYRSVRRTSAQSAAAAWRERRHPPEGWTTAHNPLHQPVDDPDARAAYFGALEGAERP